MLLYSNNLSVITTISSLIMSQFLPGCFSLNYVVVVSQIPLGLEKKSQRTAFWF